MADKKPKAEAPKTRELSDYHKSVDKSINEWRAMQGLTPIDRTKKGDQ